MFGWIQGVKLVASVVGWKLQRAKVTCYEKNPLYTVYRQDRKITVTYYNVLIVDLIQ